MLPDIFPSHSGARNIFTDSFCPITPQDSSQEEQTVCSPTFSSIHSGARKMYAEKVRYIKGVKHLLPTLFVPAPYKARYKKVRLYAS